MQLDNPRPSARQLWDWRQNAAGGVSLFQTKERETNQHYKNIYTAHPKAPKLSAEQLQLALYQYYNGGWYWDLDVASNTWKKTGSVAYGDDCVRIETLVKSGKLPPGDGTDAGGPRFSVRLVQLLCALLVDRQPSSSLTTLSSARPWISAGPKPSSARTSRVCAPSRCGARRTCAVSPS